MATAFKLFDRACYGEHPAARPVIGSRANIRRFTRADLVGYVRQQYTGANIVVGVAGDVDPDEIVAAAQAAFGDMPRGARERGRAAGLCRRHPLAPLSGCSQAHVVLGFPIPALRGRAPGLRRRRRAVRRGHELAAARPAARAARPRLPRRLLGRRQGRCTASS